eukprot:Hpha_TRINITY_DN14783_c0_g4::TRINITY_DN14783_c0_g4_i2::g.102588::m.102588
MPMSAGRSKAGCALPPGWTVQESTLRSLPPKSIAPPAPEPRPRRLDIRGGEAYIIDDFLSPAECDALLAEVGTEVRPGSGWSQLPGHGHSPPHTKGFKGLASNPVVADCADRVQRAMESVLGALRPTGRELYDYFLRYDKGCSMTSHSDLHLDLDDQDHCSMTSHSDLHLDLDDQDHCS